MQKFIKIILNLIGSKYSEILIHGTCCANSKRKLLFTRTLNPSAALRYSEISISLR